MERFLHAATEVDLGRPPARVHAAVLAAFDDWAEARSAARRTASPLRRLVATLSFDGFAGPAIAGARGGAAAPELVTFTSEVFEIFCHVLGSDRDHWTFEGQVLPAGDVPPLGALEVEVRSGEHAIATVATDELGEFSVSGLAAGRYVLVVRDDQREVFAGPIEVPAPQPGEVDR